MCDLLHVALFRDCNFVIEEVVLTVNEIVGGANHIN